LHRCTNDILRILAHTWYIRQVIEGLRRSRTLPAPFKLLDQVNDIHPATRANKTIDAWHCLDELTRAALGVAPGSDDTLSRPPLFHELLQYGTRLLPRWLDESARIDDQQVSVGRVDG
jgi:hypothetical protein